MAQEKIKLNLGERIQLLQLLPQQGDFITLQVVKLTKDKLNLSEKDFKEYQIRNEVKEEINEEDKKIIKHVTYWNKKGNQEVEYIVMPEVLEIIKNALIKMDQEKKLTFNLIGLYEKIVKPNKADVVSEKS